MISFSAGFVSIDPKLPIALAGRGGGIATSVHSRLEANVVAIAEDRRYAVVIVSIDVLFVGRELSDLILAECAKFGVPNESVLIVASHTHSAPALEKTKPLLGERSDEHFDNVCVRICDLLRNVLSSMANDGMLSRGRSKVYAGINRRRPWPLPRITLQGIYFDKTLLAPNPSGPVDPVITAFLLNGDRPAVIWHYACHPNGFPEDAQVSADFPGIVRDAIRKKIGADIPVLFLQGFSGDVRPTSGPAKFTLGSFARFVLQGPKFHKMPIETWTDWAHSIADHVVTALESATEVPVDPKKTRCRRRWALMGDLFQGADNSRIIESQQINLFGETLISVSAEPLHLLREFCEPGSILIGYSRDVFGYWPRYDQIKTGGYEVHEFKKLFGISGRWKDNTDEVFKSIIGFQ